MRSLATCRSLGAEDRGVLLQEDVYFSVARGRLKMRMQNDSAAQLIAYDRPDLPGRRESSYRIVEVDDSLTLKEALTGALGVVTVVKKSRHLFVLEGVRIHLDQVEDLGSFIEFEGVAAAGEDPQRFQSLLDRLRRSFGIENGDLLPGSYCDLVTVGR